LQITVSQRISAAFDDGPKTIPSFRDGYLL
jgi:hypothetical protein